MANINSNAKSGSGRLAAYIVIAMILGIIFGWLVNQKMIMIDMSYVGLLSTLFLRAIKMIIAPLVFSTLVVGIAQMGQGSAVGRVGLKALLWFVTASIVSLFLGLIFANLFQPGVGSTLTALTPEQIAAGKDKLAGFSQGVKDSGFVAFITAQLIPTSFADAAAGNKLLQIVFFSVFFGVALGALGKKGQGLVDLLDQLSHVMIKLTGYVMKAAPLAVFAAISSVVAEKGLSVLVTYGKFMGSFYIALFVLWALLIAVGYVFLGKRVFTLMREVKEAFFLSFATASSEAAYPKILDALDRFGVSRKISSFVMPLGYSFNLDGSMMYCTFASLFIAQFYGIELPMGTQIAMLFTLMVTSKGMAGIPSASLVVIAGTLAQFGLPVEGMLLILGVDRFLDMGRSATNAVGNSIASAVVAKWEGELLPEDQAAKRALDIQAEAVATMDHHL
ncbi:Proton/glutamate-aspartate symporter [Ephemeroptericola cinctiostellae]|uniref:Proton/glutamate-aspartate symporter n=1 Tax=Ephemeroptericola cinctiostellae TaxID=2268024 RepID=A0A345D8B8_9BURK|nr:dicarboxylate/amino acid:cation symporter [Ephemeroptericola cinctiostellae]AXF84606.1 Proton/glutamate-aspartate symporter [Ephemeroptericola cinctiostellae]